MGLYQRCRELLFSCLLLGLFWHAQAAKGCVQAELNVNGLSNHFASNDRPPGDERNEVNSGLGLTCLPAQRRRELAGRDRSCVLNSEADEDTLRRTT
jgi:hypothetical protein